MDEESSTESPAGLITRPLGTRPQAELAKEISDGSPETEDMHDDPEAPNPPRSSAEAGATEAVTQWRAAKCLQKLRDQVNALAPDRDKASDGTIGDSAHCGSANSTSDHCPRIPDGGVGVVAAIDITHDPDNGCDAGAIAASLHTGRDPRIKYIIWNKRIANSSAIGSSAPWAWRTYTGSNPHTRHVHVSVKASKQLYDSELPWSIVVGGPLPNV